MKKLASTGLALAALTMAGCATMKVSPETRAYYKQTQNKLALKPVGVISTACISRINLGKDHVLFMQSEGVGKAIAQTLNAELSDKKLTVSKVYTPFVCGQFTNADLSDSKIKFTKKAKAEDIKVTPIPTTGNQFSSTANTAFYSLFQSLREVEAFNKNTSAPVAINLSATASKTLQNTLQTDRVFVAVVNSSKPSFASQMTIGVTTAVVSGGRYTATLQGGGSGFTIYLVDLKSNQVIWNKRRVLVSNKLFRLPPTEQLNIPAILSPFYEE